MPGRTAHETAPPPLILVVDDNLDTREMYCMYLEHSGFKCVEAGNGQEALDVARRQRPVMVLMDASMPVMDGWDATRAIRGDAQLKSLPVIMVTAHAFDDHRRQAQDVGADAFLAKPVLPDALAMAVRQVLKVLS